MSQLGLSTKEKQLLNKATKSIEKHNYTEQEVRILCRQAIEANLTFHTFSSWFENNKKK